MSFPDTDPTSPTTMCSWAWPTTGTRAARLWVVGLTAAMMAGEIVAGYLTGSMALLADGLRHGDPRRRPDGDGGGVCLRKASFAQSALQLRHRKGRRLSQALRRPWCSG